MFRSVAAVSLMTLLTAGGGPARVESPAAAIPTVYEVQIDGESFLVEGNRQTELASRKKPGVCYHVAVRVAPTQPIRLTTVQFEYDLPAKVEVDARGQGQSARLMHELGYSLLVFDVGRPLDSKGQNQALDDLVKSVTSTLHDAKASDIDVTEPHDRKFSGSTARGITIRHRDASGREHVHLLYVLSGPGFTATCVAAYLDRDSDDVLPLIKKTLDSVRATEPRR